MKDCSRVEHLDFGSLFCALKEEEVRVKNRKVCFGSEEPETKKRSVINKGVVADTSVPSPQLAQIMETVKALALSVEELKGSPSAPTPPVVKETSSASGRGRGRYRGDPQPRGDSRRDAQPRVSICYNCGESGHLFRDCTMQANPSKVCEALKGPQSGN